MVGRPAGRTEKLGIEPATAQLELGLGLSLAKYISAVLFTADVHMQFTGMFQPPTEQPMVRLERKSEILVT